MGSSTNSTPESLENMVLWSFYGCSALLVGFSGATISFTAWNLVLPFLLKFFDVELFTALFISVVLDLVNAVVLTVFYGYFKKVSFKSGFIFSLISASVALIVSLSTGEMLLKNRKYLEGGIGYFPFILSLVFLIRGIVALVKMYKAMHSKQKQDIREKEQKESIDEIQPKELERNEESSVVDTALPLDEKDVENQKTSSISSDKHEANGSGAFLIDEDTCSDLSQRSEAYSVASDGTDAHILPMSINERDYYGFNSNYLHARIWWYYLTTGFAVENGYGNDMLFSKDFSLEKRIFLGLICCFFMVIVGSMSGFVYVGGGMIINVVLASLWRVDQKVATATGCFCTMLCMFVLSLTFMGREAIFSSATLYFLGVGIPCCLVGAIAGAFLSLRISNVAIYFTISAILLILGVVITVEGQL